MSYSNGLLGWGGETTTSEKNIKQPDPVFLFTRDLFHDNATIVQYAGDQSSAVASDLTDFAISSNSEIVVNKSRTYEIHFIDTFRSSKKESLWFCSTNLKDGKQANQKIMDLHSTQGIWETISLFFVTRLTAKTESHTITISGGRLDGVSFSNFFMKKLM